MKVRGSLKITKDLIIANSGDSTAGENKYAVSKVDGTVRWGNFTIPSLILSRLYEKNALVIDDLETVYISLIDDAPGSLTQDTNIWKLFNSDSQGGGTGDMLEIEYATGVLQTSKSVDNALFVNGLTVRTAVPVGAKFTDTDTIYDDTTLDGRVTVNEVDILDNATILNTHITDIAIHLSSSERNAITNMNQAPSAINPFLSAFDATTLTNLINNLDLQAVTTVGNRTDINIEAGNSTRRTTIIGDSLSIPGITMLDGGETSSILFNYSNSRVEVNKLLTASSVYISPTLDKDYAQKKYVDDAVIGGIVYKGEYIPDAGNEYPTATPTQGWMYDVTGLTVSGYLMTGGDLSGETLYNSDQLIYDGTVWVLRPAPVVNLTEYLKKDGSIDLNSGYTPINDLSIATKKYIDDINTLLLADIGINISNIAINEIGISDNSVSIIGLDGRITVNEGDIATNILNINTNISDISDNTGDIMVLQGLSHSHTNKSILDNITNFGSGKIITDAERALIGESSSGDMLKAVYDANGNNKVDLAENSELISGFTVGKNVPSNALFTDTIYTHPSLTARSINTSGAEVLDILTSNTEGHVTAASKRTMLLSDLGYTGHVDANKYVLPIATTTVLGGIKVGAGLAINAGVLSSTASGGTVTSVVAGNGMNFSTITATGSVVMGTPGALSGVSTNSVSTTSHTHSITTGAVTNGGTAIPDGNDVYDFVIGRSYAPSVHTHGAYNWSTTLINAAVFDEIDVTNGIVTNISTRNLTPSNIGAATSGHVHTTYDYSTSLSGATVFDEINVTNGIVTSISTRSLSLENLSNVTVSSIVSGEILKWNGSAWVNNTLAEAGISASTHLHSTYDYNELYSGATVLSGLVVEDGIVTFANERSLTYGDIGAASSGHTHNTFDWSTTLSGATVFDEIDVLNGIVTNISTRSLTAANIGAMASFTVHDGDGTQQLISNLKEWKFLEGSGINVNWVNDGSGSDLDPYDLQFSLKALTADWDAGGYEIRSRTFESDVTTGTAPLIIASTTKVNNLHVDRSTKADYWTTSKNLTLSGDVTGIISIRGDLDMFMTTTVANDSHSHSNYIASNANDTKTAGYTTFNTGLMVNWGSSNLSGGYGSRMFHNGSASYWDLLNGDLYIRDTSTVGDPTRVLITQQGIITATSFYESSLRELKTNILPFEKSGLDLVNSLDIYTYDKKDGSVKNKVGIMIDESPEEFASEDQTSVDLYKTIFVQAKAIQELTKRIEELEKKFN